MRDCYVSFASAADVRDFVAIATRQYFPIQVERGNLKTCATSIMSLFCMGLNQPIHVMVDDANADTAPFFEAVAPYLVA